MSKSTTPPKRNRHAQMMHAAYKSREVIEDSEGTWFMPSKAARYAGCTRDALRKWMRNGCPWLHGEKLRVKPFKNGVGREDRYFFKDQLDRILAARATSTKADEYVLDTMAAERLGCHVLTIRGWTKWCAPLGRKVRSEKRLVETKPGWPRWRTFVVRSDVDQIRASKDELSDECTTRDVAKRIGRTPATVLQYRRNGAPLLNGDKLPGRLRRLTGKREYVFPIAVVDELANRQAKRIEVRVEIEGKSYLTASEAERVYPNARGKLLRRCANKPCPQLTGETLRAVRRPRPVGLRGPNSVLYFLEDDLCRLKPPKGGTWEESSAITNAHEDEEGRWLPFSLAKEVAIRGGLSKAKLYRLAEHETIRAKKIPNPNPDKGRAAEVLGWHEEDLLRFTGQALRIDDSGQRIRTTPKRRRGRPKDPALRRRTQERNDRLLEVWNTGRYENHTQLGREFGGMRKDAVQKALQEARKRPRKVPNKNRG